MKAWVDRSIDRDGIEFGGFGEKAITVLAKIFPRILDIENITEYAIITANLPEALSIAARLQVNHVGAWALKEELGLIIVFPELKLLIKIQESDEA